MNPAAHFAEMQKLAREKRALFGVETDKFGLREVRAIYRQEKITLDYWPLGRKTKALYMCADDDFSVAINNKLPDEPKLFALVHELKHHYRDRELLGSGVIHCGDYNQNKLIEVGAEVFAAEFIYPEDEFLIDARQVDGQWTEESIVQFKRSICKAKVSYQSICKRLYRLNFAPSGKFDGVQFKKLEEKMFGPPIYKQPWFKAYRQRRVTK